MPWPISCVNAWRRSRQVGPSDAAAMCCIRRARKDVASVQDPPRLVHALVIGLGTAIAASQTPGRHSLMTETLTRTHSVLRPVEDGPVVHAWVHGVPIEADVWKQVAHLASVPGVEWVAIMPDAHIGKGARVGSAILTRNVVIPAAVGVDIGCGMIAAPLSLARSDL